VVVVKSSKPGKTPAMLRAFQSLATISPAGLMTVLTLRMWLGQSASRAYEPNWI